MPLYVVSGFNAVREPISTIISAESPEALMQIARRAGTGDPTKGAAPGSIMGIVIGIQIDPIPIENSADPRIGNVSFISQGIGRLIDELPMPPPPPPPEPEVPFVDFNEAQFLRAAGLGSLIDPPQGETITPIFALPEQEAIDRAEIGNLSSNCKLPEKRHPRGNWFP